MGLTEKCSRKKILNSPFKSAKFIFYEKLLTLHIWASEYYMAQKEYQSANTHLKAILSYIKKIISLNILEKKWEEKYKRLITVIKKEQANLGRLR